LLTPAASIRIIRPCGLNGEHPGDSSVWGGDAAIDAADIDAFDGVYRLTLIARVPRVIRRTPSIGSNWTAVAQRSSHSPVENQPIIARRTGGGQRPLNSPDGRQRENRFRRFDIPWRSWHRHPAARLVQMFCV